ncbi:response regulator transcription factor [bacterium]|nr:response regulator transcription factor [bacterium]
MMNKECKILVIDDDATNLSYLTEALEGEYELVTASSGAEGLEVAAKFKPDIILLDIMMPDMDGYEVCKRIRADKNMANIKILFLSAKWRLSEKLRGYKVGGNDYITKPYDKDEVLAKIKVFLALRYEKEITPTDNLVLEEKLLDVLYKVQNDLKDIIYIKSDAPYCRVFSKFIKDPSYNVRITVQTLEDYFKGKQLIRTHRSYMVNPHKILSVNRQKNNEYKMLLKDGNGEIVLIPIGRSYHEKIKQVLPRLFPF